MSTDVLEFNGGRSASGISFHSGELSYVYFVFYFTEMFRPTWWRHQMEKKNPCYWPYVREIHRSPVNSTHKGQWRGALMFSLFCAWINGWVNTCEAGDLWRHRAHYDVTVTTFCWPDDTVPYGLTLGLFRNHDFRELRLVKKRLRPRYIHMHHWTVSSLVHLIGWPPRH